MLQRRRVVALALTGIVGVSASLLAQKKDEKKQDEAQKKEVQNIVKLADDAAAGQPMPNDLSLTWVRQDPLKAQGNKEYVPFIVTIDPLKASGDTVAFYWRVVSKTPTAAPAAEAPDKKDKDKDKDKDKKRAEYPYEDVSFIPLTTASVPAATAPATTAATTGSANSSGATATATMSASKPAGPGGPMRIARSFTVPAGSYDLYVVAKEPTSSQKNAPPPKTSVLKQTLNVPDYWNGDLTTSSVIVAQRIDPLPAPLTPQQQADRPYAFGSNEIIPQTEMMFPKSAELQTFFMVYNPKLDSANKPDVVIEYNFYSKSAGAEKLFNHTNPQNFNAQTMPQFDAAAGHQIPGGLGVPLASFPEGDYRLEIKITDKIGNKSVTRDVNFTVTAS